MELSELISFQSNRYRLDFIRKNRKNIVPFVGAGISKACGLYTWHELLEKLSEEYFIIDEIQRLKTEKDVFEFADKIVNISGNPEMIMRRIKELFAESRVEMTNVPYLLVSMFSPMIITTNYDTLLEEASANLRVGEIKPLLPCLVGQMNDAIQLNERKLLKLHGSVEEISSFIFSSEQYKKYYGERGNRENRILPSYLQRIFESKKVLFVGCSLDKDYTLEILEECIKKNHNISHFAIVPYSRDNKKQVLRQRELTRLGIEPIYYPEGDYKAVDKLINYLAGENNFTLSVKNILSNISGSSEEESFNNDIFISLLKESFYNTAINFPELLDIDTVISRFEDDIIEDIGHERKQSDTVFEICMYVFSKYIRTGYVRCEQEVINYFKEQFINNTLKESKIKDLLSKKWSIDYNLLNNKKLNMTWLENVSSEDINNYAIDYIKKLQYKNGMDCTNIDIIYNNAKILLENTRERLDFDIRRKLLNSIGSFGYFCKDYKTAERYLEECIKYIEDSGRKDKDIMLFKAKCYANLAITRGAMKDIDINKILEATEKDISLKIEYGESDFWLSRSLNFYATVMKEINPFKAIDIYLDSVKIKKKLIKFGQNTEEECELTASWATTIFNIGLLAKDIELYELAYKIISFGNKYRFETVNECNRDYCSSLNIIAELELYVHEKKNLEWLLRGMQSRIDLPKGLSNMLAHTWYICAYYFYLQKDYKVATAYIEEAFSEARKEGAIFDFRQEIRLRLLLGKIKAVEKRRNAVSKEAERIYKDVIEDITCIYGKDSYYLIAPYRCLMKLKSTTSEFDKDEKYYLYLTDKYKQDIIDAEIKLEKYLKELK